MIIRICNVQKKQIAFSNFIDFKILVMNNPFVLIHTALRRVLISTPLRFVLIHTAHSSRLRFASSRCMLSPNTMINKQRCYAAINQKEGPSHSSKLEGRPSFRLVTFGDRCLFICAWLVITHTLSFRLALE